MCCDHGQWKREDGGGRGQHSFHANRQNDFLKANLMNDTLHTARSAGCSLYTCHVAAISKSNSSNDIDV